MFCFHVNVNFTKKEYISFHFISVVETANLCLESDNKNKMIHSKDVVVKAIDAIILLGKMNHQMTFEREERLKNALSEVYKTICEQDHSDSKQLLGNDSADNVKKAKATHSMNQSISKSKGYTFHEPVHFKKQRLHIP